MLNRDFEAFLRVYLKDNEKYTNLPPPRRINDLEATKILASLESELQELSKLPKEKYEFKQSVGKGRIADVPHICIMDLEVTKSPQREYYIVYLFPTDMSSVYLSLNQGWTLYEQTFGIKRAEQEITAVAKLLQDALTIPSNFSKTPISLKIKKADDLGRGYELGNICSKRYERDAIPTDEELIKDLRQLAKVYQELKDSMQGSIIALRDENEQDFQVKIQDIRSIEELPEGPIELKRGKKFTDKAYWPRDPGRANKALKTAGYCCENDPRHYTFPSHKNGHLFMEAHHLIPLSLQGEFKYSLDVPENIICLCPNCHRAIHHADVGRRKEMVKKFYNERKIKLMDREIMCTLGRLFDFYSRKIEDELE